MARLAREGSRSPQIRRLAVELTTKGFWTGRGLPQKDFAGETRRLTEFVRDEIRYVGDIEGVETLHDPVTVIRQGAGDCDDKSLLLASLLLAIGHTPRFKAVAFVEDGYSHVWTQDRIGGRWLDLETTEPVPFGQSVPLTGAVSFLTQDT